MTFRNQFSTSAVAIPLILALLTFATPAFAGSGGAFIGGMMASRVLGNMQRRTQAEEYQAYSQPVQQAAPSSSGGGSAEARIKQLDKLAAGGYITPAEYKSKKQAILNNL